MKPEHKSGGPIGQSVLRREDPRLLRGEGRFVDDIELPGLLETAFFRSPHAHARIIRIDLTAARALPGVVAVLAWSDLAGQVRPFPPSFDTKPDVWMEAVKPYVADPAYTALADGTVRYAGEPVAVVVAENRYIAEDALDLIEVDWDLLPAVIDPERALLPGSPLVHDRVPGNRLIQFAVTKGDPERALIAAPHRLKERFHHHRYCASPLEGRGAVAQFDRRTGELTVWSSTQSVFLLRRMVSVLLDVAEHSVRCIALDMGGGFGAKTPVYPEEILVAHLAHTLGRPVKWVEDRLEHFTSATHARDQIHTVEVGFDGEGRILALSDHFLLDNGAANPWGAIDSYNSAAHIQGPYRIEHLLVDATCVATNKVPSAPYRGAGRPEAVFAMERTMDRVALHLGLDPVLVRQRNLIPPEAMPYEAGLLYRDGQMIQYDTGDYPECLNRALATADYPTFRQRQADARTKGEFRGLGIAFYVEGTGVGPHEGAVVGIDGDGRLSVRTGAVPHGQGHETTLAQVVAELWSVPPAEVKVITGDTSAIAYGIGTYASRTAVVVGGAIWHATQKLQAKCRALAADQLECSPEEILVGTGGFHAAGWPTRCVSLKELARLARPGWDTGRPAGMEPGLEATHYFEPSTVTWAYAAHIAEVRVLPATGRVEVLKYVVAHDCGRIINPMIADAQVVGGVIQGIGGALMEELVYTPEGQLITASFMDYLIPTATDVPAIDLVHMETPSLLNPLGLKGLGEGGAIGPPAAIAGAVEDAIGHLGVRVDRTPLSPDRVRAWLRAEGGREVTL